MANTGPIQITSQVSNLQTLPDVVRFLTAFSSQVKQNFNNLVSSKIIYGSVGTSGFVLAGNTASFGASIVSSGHYYISFAKPYFTRPIVLVTMETATVSNYYLNGVTTSGFGLNGSQNFQFSFSAIGPRGA